MESSTSPQAPHLRTGATGERLAAEYLLSLGYAIRHLNARVGRDEIDIIAFDPVDDVLVFAEVRTRTLLGKAFLPEKTAGQKKRFLMKRAARRWVARHDYHGGYRMDLVCVDARQVTAHFRELSWGEERAASRLR